MSFVRSIWAVFSKMWTSEQGLSVFLVLLVLMAFVLPPLVPIGAPGRFLADAVFSLLLLSGVASVSRWRWAFYLMTSVASAALLVRWLSWFYSISATVVLREWAFLATLVTFFVVVLARVLRGGVVTIQRIEGAIAAYVLLGLSWASAYKLVALAHPGAFAGVLNAADGGGELIYFSFVTLTTMGYGDITPIHPIARSLAITEALTGQLYIAILLARLVSLELHGRRSA